MYVSILTEKKGWGMRKIADIPSDSFVNKYFGKACTNKDVKIGYAINCYKYLENYYKIFLR